MDMTQKILVACCCLALWYPVASAQETGCQSRGLPIVVRDRRGVPIDDFASVDLAPKISGKQVTITSLAQGSSPKRAVILLDRSSSMRGVLGSGQWKAALDVAIDFANVMKNRTELAFLAFDDTIHDQIDFSRGNQTVVDQLKEMADTNETPPKERRTALYDAMRRGLELLGKPGPGDTIFVITDGGDNKSRLKPTDLQKTLLHNGVGFYAALMLEEVGNRSRTPEEEDGLYTVNDFAEATGGEVITFVTQANGQFSYFSSAKYGASERATPEQALNMFYQGLFHQKLVKLELPPASRKKEQKLEIKLSEAARQKWRGATLSYPTRVLPCDATAN